MNIGFVLLTKAKGGQNAIEVVSPSIIIISCR